MITKEELANIGVPTQILAPETDPEYTPELKEYTHQVFPTLNIEYDYQFFPGLFHGFAARGDPSNPAQRRGVERAKNAVVHWFSVQLH
jgi:dienelactone hydrolase